MPCLPPLLDLKALYTKPVSPLAHTKNGSNPTLNPPETLHKNQIPESILNDTALNSAICVLPSNSNFEIHKCRWRVRSSAVDFGSGNGGRECSKDESCCVCNDGDRKKKDEVVVDNPMDYYDQDGGEWNSGYSKRPTHKSNRRHEFWPLWYFSFGHC